MNGTGESPVRVSDNEDKEGARFNSESFYNGGVAPTIEPSPNATANLQAVPAIATASFLNPALPNALARTDHHHHGRAVQDDGGAANNIKADGLTVHDGHLSADAAQNAEASIQLDNGTGDVAPTAVDDRIDANRETEEKTDDNDDAVAYEDRGSGSKTLKDNREFTATHASNLGRNWKIKFRFCISISAMYRTETCQLIPNWRYKTIANMVDIDRPHTMSKLSGNILVSNTNGTDQCQ